MSEWIDVAPVAAISPGQFETVDFEDILIAVFNVSGEFFAIEDVCTHDGEELAGGPVDGHVITCPRHGAQFSLMTGEVLAPPAYEPVRTFPVQISNGIVQVRDDRWD
ncbi:MAG: non-heme iron oxygenase ferredoxin subunit [Gammaproteobacteria bacterium]|nr:non-heme iron oxygenase ferredoxin subunit [Gammaproteobacteria bacterium]